MKIIKNCLKNLLINIKYYFVPLGISAFFIIIGLSVGLPIVISSIKSTFNGIATQIGNASFDWMSALKKIMEKVVSIDQSNGVNSVLETISDPVWVFDTLKEVAQALFGDSVSAQEIVNLLTNCANTITNTFKYIVTMAIVGFVVAFFIIMVAVRKSMTKTGWIKAIIFSAVDTVMFFVFALIYLKINPSSGWIKTIINIAYVAFIVVFSFVESYIFHGIKRLRIKEVLNLKNIVFWLIGNALTLAIGVGLAVVAVVLVPWYGGIILAIPFVEIVFLVIHMNAESYVKELALSKAQTKRS